MSKNNHCIKNSHYVYLKSFLFIFFFCCYFKSNAATTFDTNANFIKAYQHIIALKIDSGNYYIAKERREHPGNQMPILLENYIDFLVLFTSGEHTKIEEKQIVFDERIKKIKNLNATNQPYYLYIQAEIQLHTAILLVKNNEYISAVLYLRRALKLLEENNEKFPEFKPNQKSLGLLYSLLGSVPDSFKTGLSLFGMNGNIKTGMKMLKTLSADNTFLFQHETATIYAFMLFHLNHDEEGAWKQLKFHQFFNNENKMDLYAIAHIGIYGLHTEDALKALEKSQFSIDYIDFPLLDYLFGLGKTYRLDSDANLYFSKFIKRYKGADYLKAAYQKMAWNERIKGNAANYTTYITKIKTIGRSQIDADKQAEKESNYTTLPNLNLLKVRLLTDGNYYERAKEILAKLEETDFVMPKDKTEFHYRLGRIYDREQNIEAAILAYKKTIEKGTDIEAYFAANACYLLGNLYEKQNNAKSALYYYEKCLTMNGYEYHNSIMQKAKSGKNRLSND